MKVRPVRGVLFCLCLAAAWLAAQPSATQAGILGKLKAAAREKTQQLKGIGEAVGQGQAGRDESSDAQQAGADNGEDPDHPLHLTGEGHCHGHNSATCLDYMEVAAQCTAPINGYRAGLLAERIDKRLQEDAKLDPQRRQNLEEDRNAFRELKAKSSNEDPTLGGVAHSQRYLSDISDEDQIWVNAEYGRFRNRIMNKCEGADHMGVGHRTEFIKDYGPTGDEAVAEYRKTHQKAARHSAANSCLESITGLRYEIMADMMQKKMQSLTLSAQERSEWQADIAAVRKAAAGGGTAVPTVEGPNPYRPMTRLTTLDEQMTLNNEYVKETNAAVAKCKKTPAG